MTFRIITATVCVGVLVGWGCGPSETEAPLQRAHLAVGAAGDPAPFVTLMNKAREENWHALPIGQIVQNVGLHFTGKPYEAGILDRNPVEELVVTLDSFDCVLLVETALAAARGIRDQDYGFDRFRGNLLALRYRGGQLDGYCSRLHYFSEWIADNERRGTVRNITAELGGLPLSKTLTFMSEHRDSYPRFATNDSLFEGIKQMESSLSDLEIRFVPQERIHEVYEQLLPGDIIATATHIGGLDVTHTGFVHKDERGVGFLHASLASGAVKVSPDLQRYVQNIDVQIGIVVARPL